MDGRAAKLRAFYARYVTQRGGVSDARIEQAFATVPREPFAGPPPWLLVGPLAFFPSVSRYIETPDGDPAFLYQDVLVALDAARGINIGDPSFHAFCLEAIGVAEGETVIHVGAGSGYYTALLAHLVGPGGHVHAFEIDPALALRAKQNLAPWEHVDLHDCSGAAGELPRADAIYVSAGAVRPSMSWLAALKPGGRLLFPLQQERRLGAMLLVRRDEEDCTTFPARFVTRCIFVACQGLQDAETGHRLGEAFSRENWHAVRSLRIERRSDATCWFQGDGWWLSTSGV